MGLGALGLLLLPPVVFLVVGLVEGMGLPGTMTAIMEQYTVRRLNLLVVAVLSLLPLMFLALVVYLLGRIASIRASRRSLALGGLSGLLAVMVWVNLEFWPIFLPDRVAPGFPHGLEFVIGPLFFAPVAMFIGLGIAAFVDRNGR